MVWKEDRLGGDKVTGGMADAWVYKEVNVLCPSLTVVETNQQCVGFGNCHLVSDVGEGAAVEQDE